MPAESTAGSGSPRAILWAAAGLTLAVLAAYANGWATPFVFDDVPAIVDNPAIRQLWSLTDLLSPAQAGGLTTSGRPVVALSFALNYAISGEQVWSYHLVNIAVHLAAGLVLLGIVWRTLLLPRLRSRWGEAAGPLATAVAAVWLLHPLQTESVTYVVQRAESLAGLFCLLTLYGFIRGVAAESPRPWLVFSVAACLGAMASKEVAVAAPLLVWLYDRTFVSGTCLAAWRARRSYYVALGATWVLLGWLVVGTAGRGSTAGFGSGVSAWSYALTQCHAIVRYLQLSVWPSQLVFDYGLGTVSRLAAVWPQALAVLALVLATGWALVRRPGLGFLGAWFFALLAPSSSFVPVATQTMAEHRMYLPLGAIVVLAVLASQAVLRSRVLLCWGVVAVALGGATARRNHDYRSEAALWEDTALKWPANARAHNNLGQAQFRAGRIAEAMRSYERALQLQPNYPETHYNLGVALAQQDQLTLAVGHYETALRLTPDYAEAHTNLGNALVRLGRVPEALDHYEAALRHRPRFAEAHNNLGNALLQSGRAAEALARFQRALALKPEYPEACYNLGNALAAVGQMREALEQYRRAIALKPDYAEAQVNAGNALLELGRPAEAAAHYERALAVNPALAEAQFNLGSVELDRERWPEAIGRFEAVLRLNPASTDAHRRLGYALAQVGRNAEAIAHYEAFLRAVPGDTAAQEELARIRAAVAAGRRK